MNRLIGVVRRPWSKPTLVLVTALVAGVAGYAVASTRPGDAPPVAAPSMAVESWLGEFERDPVAGAVGEPARKALEAAPPGVEVVTKTVVTQNPYVMSGTGLMALPAGTWALYASCRMEESADTPETLKAELGISGGGVEHYPELRCPADGGEPLVVLEPKEDTVYSFTVMPEISDEDDEKLWELAIAVGVFVAAA